MVHNYEIARDLWTNPLGTGPGVDYPLVRWRAVEPLLPNVTGKNCLDIGCSSGFFSLKFKELGAAYVLGIDSGEQIEAIKQARFAAGVLRLDVEFLALSVYDLAALARKFDLILFMGVFYHLRHPMVALEAARAACRETMVFQTITTKPRHVISDSLKTDTQNVGLRSAEIEADSFPALRFVEGALDGDFSCWFVPNVAGVGAMLRSTGFIPEATTFTTDREVIVRCAVNP